jgi:hypothetical protein
MDGKTSKIISVLVITIFTLFNLFSENIILAIIKPFTPYLPFGLVSTIEYYMRSTIYAKNQEFNTGLGALMIVLVVYAVVILYKKQRISEISLNSFLAAYVVNNLGFPLLGRFSYYFILVGGGIFSYNVLLKNRLFARLYSFKYMFMILVLAYFVLAFFKGTLFIRQYGFPPIWDLMTPYHSVFFSVDVPGRETLGRILTNELLRR